TRLAPRRAGDRDRADRRRQAGSGPPIVARRDASPFGRAVRARPAGRRRARRLAGRTFHRLRVVAVRKDGARAPGGGAVAVKRLDRYAVPGASIVAATLLTFVLQPWMGRSFSMMFSPAVLVTALYGGYPPALLATVLATLSLAYFFIDPLHSFSRLGI